MSVVYSLLFSLLCQVEKVKLMSGVYVSILGHFSLTNFTYKNEPREASQSTKKVIKSTGEEEPLRAWKVVSIG